MRGNSSQCGFRPPCRTENPQRHCASGYLEKAEQVLSESRQIVFAGFSLNPDDTDIKQLLDRACSADNTSKVTIVLNGSHPEIVKRYRKIYRDRVESYESGWVQYLREQ